ncbi:rRNA maturation RNase YbeY [Proteinivorax hydrogeniformans]|uniref:Endoribonuclease YbeY n=1 Tax=Proteinivorax hydrogeniformans TaxID=1826727 RepID=A0AAU8HWP3_9FIRM
MIDANIEALEELHLDNNIEDYILHACSVISKMENVSNKEVNIIFVDNPFIKHLNEKFRGKDKPTDVLSFPLETGLDDEFLGEIYISLDKAREQAKKYGHSLDREVVFLAIHGLLHLAGYEHDEAPNPKMREKEEKVLEELGLFRG